MRLTLFMKKLSYNKISSKILNLLFEKFLGKNDFKPRARYDYRIPFYDFVFLCGGNYKEYDSRNVLANILNKKNNIQIIISERLISTRGLLDLLTFEIVLEAISKMVLICLESMGSACELGAFSNIGDSNKEVVIINKEYAKDESFINQGPLAYLKSKNDNRVIVTNFIKQPNKKTSIELNSEIFNIPKHHLINDGYKITTYYKKDDKGNITIINLSTLSAVILDYLCLFLIGNPTDFLLFLKKLHGCNNVLINSNNITDESKLELIIETIMNIYVELGFARKEKDYYFANGNVIMSDAANKWVGELIFTSKTTESKDFLSFKAKVSLMVRDCYASK